MVHKIVLLLCCLILFPISVNAFSPIAHTDVVPYQRIEYGTTFNFGVVAFSKGGIDRVDFAISGQGYASGTKTTSTMRLNTRVATTSPGAEYPGVYEYYVEISSSEFSTNGTITVIPTVYGNTSGSRVLPTITLYVEGASDEAPVEAWISPTGNDSTGTVNNRNLPYATLAGAVTDIEAANGGDCDGAIVYFEEGTYTISSGTTTTNNDRLTITRASGAAIENTIITEGGSSWDTTLLKVSGLTLTSSGTNDPCLVVAGAWVDHCRLLGGGRTNSLYTNATNCTGGYWTGNYNTNCGFGLRGNLNIARGVKVYYISEDLGQNAKFVVNTVLDDMDPVGTGAHSDVFQGWGYGADNWLYYNIIATNTNYQYIYFKATYDNAQDLAFVNVSIELRSCSTGGGNGKIAGVYDHLLFWHNTLFADLDVEFCGSIAWGSLWLDDDAFGYSNTNSSFIGNYFHRFWLHSSALPSWYLYGNANNNEALYNHQRTSYNTEFDSSDGLTTYSYGTGVIDQADPESSTFGHPVEDSTIHNRLPSNITGIMCDALGNPRDSTPDIGAFEYSSDAAPTNSIRAVTISELKVTDNLTAWAR